jgi:hypothetical protein
LQEVRSALVSLKRVAAQNQVTAKSSEHGNKEHRDKAPNETVDNIKIVVRSPITPKHREILESKDHPGLIAKLKRK